MTSSESFEELTSLATEGLGFLTTVKPQFGHFSWAAFGLMSASKSDLHLRH